MTKKKLPQWVKDFYDHPLDNKQKEDKILKRFEETAIIDMEPVCSEIEKGISSYSGRQAVFAAIIHSAAFIESGEKQKLKNERKDLRELQKDISLTVGKLICLLDKHERSQNELIYHSAPYQDPIQLIDEAGRNMRPITRSRYFKMQVSPVLGMNPVFDRSYKTYLENMPKLQEVLQILKNRMNKNIKGPGIFKEVLIESRKSVANNALNGSDFIRLFVRNLNMSSDIPADFTLTAKTIAIITSRALGLQDYTEAAVKRVFQNMRKPKRFVS